MLTFVIFYKAAHLLYHFMMSLGLWHKIQHMETVLLALNDNHHKCCQIH